MTTPNTTEFEDLWLDAALEELIGGNAPPDVVARRIVEKGSTAREAATVHSHYRASPRAIDRRLIAAIVVFVLGALPIVAAFLHRGASTASTVGVATPLRVLYVEYSATWDYRYTKNALLRADTAVALQAFLLSAADGFEQEHSASLPALTKLPATREELAPYQVILLGDVRPNDLIWRTAEATKFAANLASFVADGGGLALLSGPRGMPSDWRATAVAALLPLTLDPAIPIDERAVALTATAVGERHPILVDGGDAAPIALFDGHFASTVPNSALGSPRDNAEVLLADHDAAASPLLTVWHVGRGRVALAALSGVWRMHRDGDPARHARLWSNLVTWLAPPP